MTFRLVSLFLKRQKSKRLICIIGFRFISDSDLHMTALALELCCTLMSDRRSGPTVGMTVRNKVLPQALALVKSSLLQGQALLVLLNLCIGLTFHERRCLCIPDILIVNCRLCKTFLLLWFTLQTRVLMLCWNLFYQLLNRLLNLVVLQNKLCFP